MMATITAVLAAGCAPRPPLTWAGPVRSDSVAMAVVGASSPPVGLGDADVVVRVGRLAEPEAWRGLPLVAMDATVGERRHTRRFTGIGRPDVEQATPYGSLELETDGVPWRLVYLTTRSGRVREEQGYWLPRAMDADRLVVVVDGVDPVLRETVEELTAPLALAVWIQPGPTTTLPDGPFGVLSLAVAPSVGSVRLTGERIEVKTSGETWARERLGWTRVSD